MNDSSRGSDIVVILIIIPRAPHPHAAATALEIQIPQQHLCHSSAVGRPLHTIGLASDWLTCQRSGWSVLVSTDYSLYSRLVAGLATCAPSLILVVNRDGHPTPGPM